MTNQRKLKIMNQNYPIVKGVHSYPAKEILANCCYAPEENNDVESLQLIKTYMY
jgi:hypothetical protein